MISKDKAIINSLIKNSRMGLKEISKLEDIPVSTIFDRIERLKEKGIINNFSCLLDYKYLRCPLEYIFITIGDPGEDIRINHSYSLSDKENFFTTAIFRDIKDLEDFRLKLRKKKIKIKKMFPIYERIKENALILD